MGNFGQHQVIGGGGGPVSDPILDSSDLASIKITDRELVADDGVFASLDWQLGELYTSLGAITAKWKIYQLFGSDTNISHDWSARILYDGAVKSIEYNNRTLFDQAEIPALDYNNRQLKHSNTTIIFDWENQIIQSADTFTSIAFGAGLVFINGNLKVSGDIFTADDTPAIGVFLRTLVNAGGFGVFNWNTKQFFADDGIVVVLSWNDTDVISTVPITAPAFIGDGSLLTGVSVTCPEENVMTAFQSRVISGDALQYIHEGNAVFGGYMRMGTTPADGGVQEWQIYLKAGVYSTHMVAYRGTNASIVDWLLDGATMFTTDFYGATQFDIIYNNTDVQVLTDGLHTIRATVNGKNGSSSGYFFLMGFMRWFRTGDLP